MWGVVKWVFGRNSKMWCGEPNSLHTFCEPKQATVRGVQEFYNTLSCLVYVVVGGGGLAVARSTNSNWRICMGWCALLVVGLSSGFFHATLRYSAELFDEVTMLVLVFSFLLGKEDTVSWLSGPRRRLRFRVAVATLLLSATLLYVTVFVYEIFCYTFLVAVVVEIAIDLAARPRTWQTRVCFFAAVAAIGLGYVVWQLEQNLCAIHPHVWPLHVVWHFLSCVGGSFAILHNVFLRREKIAERRDALASQSPAGVLGAAVERSAVSEGC